MVSNEQSSQKFSQYCHSKTFQNCKPETSKITKCCIIMIYFQFFHVLFQVLNCRHHTQNFHEPWELDFQQFLHNPFLPMVWGSEKVMECHGIVHQVTRVNVHELLQSSDLMPVNKHIHECPNLLFICNILCTFLCHDQHTDYF